MQMEILDRLPPVRVQEIHQPHGDVVLNHSLPHQWQRPMVGQRLCSIKTGAVSFEHSVQERQLSDIRPSVAVLSVADLDQLPSKVLFNQYHGWALEGRTNLGRIEAFGAWLGMAK